MEKPTLTQRLLSAIGMAKMSDADFATKMADPAFKSGGAAAVSVPTKTDSREAMSLYDHSAGVKTGGEIPVAESDVKRLPLKKRLLSDPRLDTPKMAVAQAEAVRAGVFEHQFQHTQDASARREHLKMVMNEAPSPAERDKYLNEIALLNDPRAVENCKLVAQGEIGKQFPPVRDAALALLDVADTIVTEFIAEAVKAETEFFSAWGLDREPTALIRRLNGVAADLTHLREGYQRPQADIHRIDLGRPWKLPVFEFFKIAPLPSVKPSYGPDPVLAEMRAEIERLKGEVETKKAQAMKVNDSEPNVAAEAPTPTNAAPETGPVSTTTEKDGTEVDSW